MKGSGQSEPMTGLLFGQPEQRSITRWMEDTPAVQTKALHLGWFELTYASRDPLLNEGNSAPRDTSEFIYKFLVRPSGSHVILVSSENAIVEAILRHIGISNKVHLPKVDVEKLVMDLTSLPSDRFVMSTLFAKVEGYGTALRSMALWGADLADAHLFQSIRSQLIPFRVELRDVRSGVNLLSISTKAELSFYYDGSRSLEGVLDTIKYLTQRSYIQWER